jgi:hypothetical protein
MEMVCCHSTGRFDPARDVLTLNRIFIIEGAITAFIATLAPFIMVDWPEQCRFFNAAERDLIQARLVDDGGECRMDTLNRDSLRRILLDGNIYLGYVCESVLRRGIHRPLLTNCFLSLLDH